MVNWGHRCSLCEVRCCSAPCKRKALERACCTQGQALIVAAPTGEVQEEIAPATSDHAPTEEEIDEMLRLATAQPAVRTLMDIPHVLENRVATLLRDLLARHVDAEHAYWEHPGIESGRNAARASRWAWLGPVLLLRTPAAGDVAGRTSGQGDFTLTKLLRERVQLAEVGRWTK
eukprot:10709331-Karenia_brevis.AAC.1